MSLNGKLHLHIKTYSYWETKTNEYPVTSKGIFFIALEISVLFYFENLSKEKERGFFQKIPDQETCITFFYHFITFYNIRKCR